MSKKANNQRISCYSCRHFYVTWDPSLPYGCQAMGFKSRALPSQAVFMSSGMDCLMYTKKESSPLAKKKPRR